MRSDTNFLIELRNVYFLRTIVEWVHYNFDEQFVNLVEELLNLLLVFIVLVKDEESGT